jgi:hypothetical protein
MTVLRVLRVLIGEMKQKRRRVTRGGVQAVSARPLATPCSCQHPTGIEPATMSDDEDVPCASLPCHHLIIPLRRVYFSQLYDTVR